MLIYTGFQIHARPIPHALNEDSKDPVRAIIVEDISPNLKNVKYHCLEIRDIHSSLPISQAYGASLESNSCFFIS